MERRRIYPQQRENFEENVVAGLKRASRALEGRKSASAFDQPALHPGYEQLQHHLDRALRWAEELQWIIEREFSGRSAA